MELYGAGGTRHNTTEHNIQEHRVRQMLCALGVEHNDGHELTALDLAVLAVCAEPSV